MSEFFPESKSLGGKVKVELDLSNYATKADLKNATGIDTSSFPKNVDSGNLKSNLKKLSIDKLKNVPFSLSNLKSKEVDKLVPAPVDLSKLSDVVKHNVVKKDVYNVKIKNIEYKIANINNLATKTTLNAKINEVKDEIPIIKNLATNACLVTAENRSPNVSNLV